MRKRVLVAETADAVRQVVESVLRQSGYDVIGVSSYAKAAEVLQFSKPDLIVTSGDLSDDSHQLFYERVQNDPQTGSIPLLVIEPADKSAVAMPPEVVLGRPIDPGDLAQRVRIFLGEASGQSVRTDQNPLSAVSADDRFLDEALGLDRIDVTKSEDMDKTGSLKLPKSKTIPPGVTPYDHAEDDASMTDSRKVEFLQVREDATDIRVEKARPAAPKEEPAGSGKLEIMSDQYGISDPAAFRAGSEQRVHDYDWFINAVRDDVAAPSLQKNAPATTGPVSDSQKINLTSTASIVDPITSATASKVIPPPAGAKASKSQTEGVEKFIDEFKREIELLRAREPEPVSDPPAAPKAPATTGLSWEEQVETLSVDHIRLFAKELTSQLASRIAEQMVSKIDPDKLLSLLKEEIVATGKRQSGGKR